MLTINILTCLRVGVTILIIAHLFSVLKRLKKEKKLHHFIYNYRRDCLCFDHAIQQEITYKIYTIST